MFVNPINIMNEWGFRYEVLNDTAVRVTRRARIEGELLDMDALIDIAHCALRGGGRPNAVVRLLQSKVFKKQFSFLFFSFHLIINK